MADVGAVVRARAIMAMANISEEVSEVSEDNQIDAATAIKYADAIWQLYGTSLTDAEGNPREPTNADKALAVLKRVRHEFRSALRAVREQAARDEERAEVATEIDSDIGAED